MKKSRILIVDDEPGIRDSLSGVLEDEGFVPLTAATGEECLDLLAVEEVDAVLLDVWLPGIDGLEVLERIERSPSEVRPAVIMISGHASIESAVRATKIGAFDFLEKPLTIQKVIVSVNNALNHRRMRTELLELKSAGLRAIEIIGKSIPIKALRQQISLMAPTNGRVLIYGESGTGKEIVARAIHGASPRSEGPFVEVNCAAIPEEMIESELFGLRRAAHDGGDKTGRFEQADGGTLFLDEVGDMSLKTQAKVLRALDEHRFSPVGSSEPVQADVRVIASTNKHLDDEIERGNFREDLFYRLNVIPFFVPPLRERAEDIPALAGHFLAEFTTAYGRKPKELTPEALDVLSRHAWPGNVRELKNLMERIVIMHPQIRIDARHIPLPVERKPADRPAERVFSLHEVRQSAERDYILRKLDEVQGNVTRAAELLGLERSNLYKKMRALGIAPRE
ncbi:MAG: Fis family transcriptional regulator [Candidatus Solibacter sp.]|nr:Fis family transcriptional regulator [Candidatus Solibacter sp.]